MKKKLLSITRKDFDIQTFRSGGKGGQHQNTTDSGVRIIHRDSGAVGESRNHKSQHQNKKEALARLTASSKFRIWVNRRAHEIITGETIEQEVDRMMQPENLKIEVRENGKWTEKEAD
jgi:protein subunit release factor B